MVLEGPNRLLGHRRDRLPAEQLLDVERVAVARVLRRRRRPQAALRGRAAGGEPFPAIAGERVLVLLVGEPGVGDPEAALQVFAAELVEATVGLGVDPRDEEAGDGVDGARVAADADEALEAAQVGLDHLLVAGEREDQGHVDRAAAGGHLFDRPDAGVRGRDLDQQVRPRDRRVEHRGLVDRGLGVVGEVGVDLDRDVAVTAAGVAPRPAAGDHRRRRRRASPARGRAAWRRRLRRRGSARRTRRPGRAPSRGWSGSTSRRRPRPLRSRGRARRTRAGRARGSRSRRSARARRADAGGSSLTSARRDRR